MLLRRFEAKTLDTALRLVRKELGDDALLVETRQTARGFLVVAAEAGTDPRTVATPAREPAVTIPRAAPPREPEWTPGFRDLATHGLGFGLSVDVLRAVERALGGTRVNLTAPGDPAVPKLATRILQGLVPTTTLDPERFAVTALIGPTGVGKTTTLAKLAARFQKAGERVAVITIDTYRIAAVEQLRAYADLLQAEFEVAFTPAELQRAVTKAREGHDRVLVDTTGRSPLDARSLGALRATLRGSAEVARLLCLPAGMRRADAAEALRGFDGLAPDALVLTKWDETRQPGEVFSLAIERNFPMSHVAVGQEVPDDLVVADARALAIHALGQFRTARAEDRAVATPHDSPDLHPAAEPR